MTASRWPLSSSSVQAIQSRLRALPVGIRRTTLRALAGDRTIEEELREGLAAERVAVREWAAAAVELLGTGGRGLRRQLREAMAGEQEPTAFEAMVHAAVRLDIEVPAVAIRRFLQDSRGRAAALKAIPTLGGEARGAVFRRALRAGLWESDEAVVRAAVRALAARRDTAAWPALVRRYETASESVQTLIARHAASFRSHPRYRQTRAALVRTSPSNRAAWFAEPAEGRGVLRFQVDGELTADGVFCRAILPTGEIRIRRTLPGGEVFFAHQPEGVADVLPARTDRDLR